MVEAAGPTQEMKEPAPNAPGLSYLEKLKKLNSAESLKSGLGDIEGNLAKKQEEAKKMFEEKKAAITGNVKEKILGFSDKIKDAAGPAPAPGPGPGPAQGGRRRRTRKSKKSKSKKSKRSKKNKKSSYKKSKRFSRRK
jgi:hypothetical protein